MPERQEKKILEELVLDPLLEELESKIGKFNILEAIGAVKQESRHSDFLAFLLNPNQNHGLDDVFLKRLLQKVIARSEIDEPSINQIDLDIWDLSHAEILREWSRTDILVLDQTNELVVVVENKISSSEGSSQLKRYREKIEHSYPNFKKVFLYLTPEGDIPSDKTYLAVDYSLICELVEDIAKSRASLLGADVVTIMKHYTEMLRRHVVSESEIGELCRKIYAKHQKAIDLIFENRPDTRVQVREILEGLIKQNDSLILDDCTKAYIRFADKNWDNVTFLREGNGWTSTGRILLFEFCSEPKRLNLKLCIGPGHNEKREKIHSFIKRKNEPVFNKVKGTLGSKWKTIYSKDFLRAKDYEDIDKEDLEKKIQNKWYEFIMNDFQRISISINLNELSA